MKERTGKPRPPMSARSITVLALMGAITFAAQLGMAALPNIEPVTPLLMCCALVFGRRAFFPCAVFVLLEGLYFGMGPWFVSYLYVWPLLIGATLALRRSGYVILTALGAGFGLVFGALCAIPYLFIGGFPAALSYWVSGIPFDLLHCAGSAAMCALLLRPLHRLLQKLTADGSTDK